MRAGDKYLDEVEDAKVRLLLVHDEDEVQRGVVPVHHLALAPVLNVQLCGPARFISGTNEHRLQCAMGKFPPPYING